MAEIKSTLELAMERTKRMSISEEEREEMKRKEMLQKASILFHRYVEGHLPWDEISKEIDRIEEEMRRPIMKEFLSQLINAFSLRSLGEHHEKLFQAIESLKNRNVDSLKQKFDRLLSRYRHEKERAKQKVADQLLEKLRTEGIYGSAVEPRPETSPLWGEASEALERRYEVDLKGLKEQLMAL